MRAIMAPRLTAHKNIRRAADMETVWSLDPSPFFPLAAPRETIFTMKLADIRELHAAAKTATAGRGTGPRTEKGKLRSSLNAVRHGLSATHMLLPGEDNADYERRMDAIFVALDPKDEAQAQLVAL